MKKRFSRLMLMLSLASCALTAMAVTVSAQPTDEDFVISVEDGKATITSFNKDYIGEVDIPSTIKGYQVTKIADEAFKDCTNITSVSFPTTITSIPKYAFQNCSNIMNVTIPSTVKGIGDSAFESCKRLSNIDLPESVILIGTASFKNCSLLSSIELPDSVTSVGNSSFQGCSALKDVRLSPNMTGISERMFYDCSSLTNIIIPQKITSVGYVAFGSCGNIQNVYYSGNESDWGKISVNTDKATWNYGRRSTDNAVTFVNKIADGTIKVHYNSAVDSIEDIYADQKWL